MTGFDPWRTVTAYLAPEGFEPLLAAELKEVLLRHGRLFVAQGRPRPVAWAQNIWHRPERLAITSIKDAVRQLRERQRNWAAYAHGLHRRTGLIQEGLPPLRSKPLPFPTPVPTTALGSFTLLDESTLLAAADCRSPYPNGEPVFEEWKVGPPSRAYLKLFEALTLHGSHPLPGERCVELGASPGGWTWVLARLGCAVTAYDRADLDPGVAAMPGVTAVRGDAFAATPAAVGAIDWLFSDVICYPERLLAFVGDWIASGQVRHIVVTVKFQGEGHYGVIPAFQAVPGGRLLHLAANKHELTFLWRRPDPATNSGDAGAAGTGPADGHGG